MKSSSKKTGRKSALEVAKEKASREQRKISVHEEQREKLSESIYYVTPTKKVTEGLSESFKHVKTFEPETGQENHYQKIKLRNVESFSEGDRVSIDKEESLHTITEVTTRQIITNFGDKFRKSDGVEWGGGEKEITHKLVKQK